MIEDLFADDDSLPRQWREPLSDGAVVLRGYAQESASGLLREIDQLARLSPFRHLITPGGHRMSVAMTSCGSWGWISDELGYRYSATDPLTAGIWPAMPVLFHRLAVSAAAAAGYAAFNPDVCLVNRYLPGARLTLHQDKNERDLAQPIVSFSLGLTATFMFGGAQRTDPCRRLSLQQGDVLVWGGASRLNYHGVLPLKQGLPPWPCREAVRYNLTFRRVTAKG